MAMKTKFLVAAAVFLASTLMTGSALAQNGDQAFKGSTEKLPNLAAVINSIPDIIFYKDLDGIYRGGNKAWAQLTGHPLDDLIGKSDFDLFPLELAKSFRAKDQEMLTARQTTRNEEWVDFPDGRHVLLDTLKTPWFDGQGKVLGVLGISRDITSRYSEAADASTLAALRTANDQFYAALNAMFIGDLAPMNAIWSQGDDVSNQGPFGNRMDGWAAVGEEFKKEAGMKLGGRVICQDPIVRAGKDLGYTVCVEQGENMTTAGRPKSFSHRATNIFRLENGQWRLVHHHTDLSPQLEQAAAENAYGSAGEARAMLMRVVDAVKSDKSKALDMFNKGEGGFLDRDLYPFCINVSDGTAVAHGGPLSKTYLGQDIRQLKDAAGKAYGSEIFAAAQKPEGEITEVRYMYPKPNSGSAPVPKISYVTRIGDIGCGVGHYAQPVTRDEAVTMVQKAIAAIKTQGSDERGLSSDQQPVGPIR